jgi:hypothetical protein
LLALVKSRRTIHAITSDSIPDDLVADLLEASRRAPTGFIMHPVGPLVVKDSEFAPARWRGMWRRTRANAERSPAGP